MMQLVFSAAQQQIPQKVVRRPVVKKGEENNDQLKHQKS